MAPQRAGRAGTPGASRPSRHAGRLRGDADSLVDERVRELERTVHDLTSLASLSTGDEACWIVDAAWTEVRFMNRAARRLFGLPEGTVALADLLASIDSSDHEAMGTLSKAGGHRPSIRVRDRSGRRSVVACTAVVRRRASGEVADIAFLAADVTATNQHVDEIEFVAEMAARRRGAADRAWAELVRAVRVTMGAEQARLDVIGARPRLLAESRDDGDPHERSWTTTLDVAAGDEIIVLTVRGATRSVRLSEDSLVTTAIRSAVLDVWTIEMLREQLAAERRRADDADGAQRALRATDEALELTRIAEAGLTETVQVMTAQLSDFSHECRNVLNSVCGFAQILARGDLDDGQVRAVDHILVAGRHLTALLDDVLDVARADGIAPGADQSLAIEPLIEESLALVATTLEDRHLHVVVDVPGVSVRATAHSVRQVLVNLLSNAAKYGGSEVRVSGRVIGPLLRIEVTDNGPGIAPERCERLFQRFDRGGLDGADRRGTGLGLALCRRLVEALDGSIGVRSSPGSGSTFWFELPCSSGSALPADVARGGRVVVAAVPDDPTVELLHLAFASMPTWQPRLTRTCSSALDIVRRVRPRVVLVDLDLPRCDQLVAAAHSAGSSTIVVALTTGQPDASHPGIDAWLRKPWSLDDLTSVLEQ